MMSGMLIITDGFMRSRGMDRIITDDTVSLLGEEKSKCAVANGRGFISRTN